MNIYEKLPSLVKTYDKVGTVALLHIICVTMALVELVWVSVSSSVT